MEGIGANAKAIDVPAKFALRATRPFAVPDSHVLVNKDFFEPTRACLTHAVHPPDPGGSLTRSKKAKGERRNLYMKLSDRKVKYFRGSRETARQFSAC